MTRSQHIQLLKRQPRLGYPIIEDIQNAIKTLSVVAEEIGASQFAAFNQRVQQGFLDMAKEATYFEERLSALNENFGISSKAASQLAQGLEKTRAALNGTDKASKELADSVKISNLQMQQYASNIKKMLPTLNQASDAMAGSRLQRSLIRGQRILKTNIGLTDEQTNSYTQFAAAGEFGIDAQLRLTKAISAGADGVDSLGTFKMITQEIAEAGAEIQLQYGRLPGSLEGAVLKAKKLGFSLQDVTKIGDTLLNIESSIGAELEYQLLSGKRLVDQDGKSLTNKYREATLQGNATKQAETLEEIVQSQGEVLEKNLFARKQLAKTMGIEEKQLASAIQKQKILEKASEAGIVVDIDDEGSLKEAANILADQGELTADEFEQFQKDLDTRTTDDILKQQLTVQREQLMMSMLTNDEADKLREALTSAAGGAAGMMATITGTGVAEGAAGTAKITKESFDASIDAVLGVIKAENVTRETAKIDKKALGGAVMGGKPYLVGEQGQELFLPSVNGTIASNSNTTNGTPIKTDNSDVVAALDKLGNTIITAVTSQPAGGINEGMEFS